MHSIYICLYCPNRFTEIIPDEKENSAQMIKEEVTEVLLDHFPKINVEEVVIDSSSGSRQPFCSIHIHALGPDRSLSLCPQQLERVALTIEDKVSRKLMQLFFGMLRVKCVTITCPPYDYVDIRLSCFV